jgi:hypothetical protein
MSILSGQVVWGSVALGLGAIAVPSVLPSVAAAARPVAKTIIKQGMFLYIKGEQVATKIKDGWTSIVHEAMSEIQEGEDAAGKLCQAVEDPAQQISECSQY